jgi:hypothetical protein
VHCRNSASKTIIIIKYGKDDITLISDNFNAIGMSDTLLGGRHFFYKLGNRFQELTVESNGDKDLNAKKKYRNLLNRLG